MRDEDPELLPPWEENNRAQTALAYFRAACRERHTSYTKRRPGPLLERTYLVDLAQRTHRTGHLPSFARALQRLAALGATLPSAP